MRKTLSFMVNPDGLASEVVHATALLGVVGIVLSRHDYGVRQKLYATN